MNNDLEQFSEERLKDITEFRAKLTPLDGVLLARIALAAKQAKPTFEDWLSSRTDTIEVDCGCVTTEAFYHWLKVAYEATPQPAHTEQVIPSGWKLVPVEPTEAMLDEFDSIIDFGANDSVDAWRRLIAAAPKPESE